MSDNDFGRLFDALPGEPSDEFAAALRQRLEIELGLAPGVVLAAEGGHGDEPVEVETMSETRVEKSPRRPRQTPWLIAAVAAAVVLVAVLALALLRDDDTEEVPMVDEDEVPTSVAPSPDVTGPAVPAGWAGIPAPEACSNGIPAATPDGTLWFGALGLYRWDGESWTWITHEQGLPASPGFDPEATPAGGGPCGSDNDSPSVTEIAAAPDGTLWLSTGDYAGDVGVSSFDGEEFTVHGRPNDQPTRDVGGEGLYVDESGDAWLYLTEYEDPEAIADPADPERFTGAARLDGSGSWVEYPLDQPLDVMDHRFRVGLDGTAWFAGAEGVWRLEGETWVAVETGPVDELGVIGSAAAGPDGDIWVAVYPDGGGDLAAMAHWVDGEWEIHDSEATLGDLLIGQFIVAPDGTLWVAAAPAGFFDVDPVDVGDPAQSLVLVSFDGTEFVSHVPEGTEQGITLNFPYSVITDGTSIWVGSMPGDGDFVRFTPE